MRYRVELSYDGAEFCGWQIQPKDPSVQETLERALGTLLRDRVPVTGAGRTDTGVSASFYVAHFDFDGPVPEPLAAKDNSLDCKQLRFKLNAILPKSVCILQIAPAAPDFNARFDAVRRQYTYYLHRVKDPFCERYSYYYAYPEVDFDAMNRAAGALLGTHDFSCFEKSGGDNKTSVCTVFTARWEPCHPVPAAGKPEEECPRAPFSPILRVPVDTLPSASDTSGVPYWRFVIEADRFLRNMVRAIVGTLLEVGRGRRSTDEFASLILPPQETRYDDSARESRRSEAGESVPGHALFLTDIRY